MMTDLARFAKVANAANHEGPNPMPNHDVQPPLPDRDFTQMPNLDFMQMNTHDFNQKFASDFGRDRPDKEAEASWKRTRRDVRRSFARMERASGIRD